MRRDGFIASDQEVITGLRLLAAPVLDIDGRPCAAVSVAAPALHMPFEEFVACTAGPVMEAAGAIGKATQVQGAAGAEPARSA